MVALLAEGVDRNLLWEAERWQNPVALLAEGVDRNFTNQRLFYLERVALLAEGVDRNPVEKKKRQGEACRPPRGGRG